MRETMDHPKFLSREDLEKVEPQFREMVEEAWENGEDVPYGVIFLSNRPLTEREKARGAEILREMTESGEWPTSIGL